MSQRLKFSKHDIQLMIAVVLTGMVLPLIFSQMKLPTSITSLILLLFVWATPLVYNLRKNRINILSVGGLSAGSFFFYFIVPVIDLLLVFPLTGGEDVVPGTIFFGPISTDQDISLSKAILVATLGIALFWLSYTIICKRKNSTNKRSPLVTNMLFLWIGALILIVIGGLGYAWGIFRLGGWNVWRSSHWYRRYTAEPFSQVELFLRSIRFFMIPGAVLIFAIGVKIRRRLINYLPYIVPVVIVFILLTLEGARRYPLVLALVCAFVWNYLRRPLSKKILVTAAIVGLIVLFVGVPFRTVISQVKTVSELWQGMASIMQGTPERLREFLDYPMSWDDFYLIVNEVPTTVKPLYGASFLRFLTFVVPRSLYPEKPEPFSLLVTKTFKPELYDRGISHAATIIGEAYFNLLIPGVFVIMLPLGLIAAQLDNWFIFTGRGIEEVIIYSLSSAMFFDLIRGPFADTVLIYSFQILPTISIIWLNSRNPQD